MSCNILADLPAVRILQNYVPYQRSQFSLLAKLLVTAPQPRVESLAEEAHHTDTIWTNSLSEETGKPKPQTLWREMWVATSWILIKSQGRASKSQLNINDKIKMSLLSSVFSSVSLNPCPQLWKKWKMNNNLRSDSESDQLLFRSHFTMKMIMTRTWSNTLVPRSPDRWHVAVRACPQLRAAAQQREAVAQPSTRPLHSIGHQNYMTNMLPFSGGSGEHAIMACLHDVLHPI